jgi:2-keto-3-deoxy-L-rhamnonate aldolase RhmA
MGTDRIHKQAMKYRPKGKRSMGRPRKRWKDQFHLEG